MGYTATVDARPKSVTADTAVERMCYFLTHAKRHGLWSAWYHVHRTEAVQQAARVIRDHEFTDPVALELHMHLHLLFAGRYMQADVPFWVVQLGSSQLTSELEARGTLAERFVRSNAMTDLQRSLQSLAPLSADDRERIHEAIAAWLAEYAQAAAPAPRADAAAAGPIERLYRGGRRLLRPIGAVLRRTPENRAELRLPTLEPYILDPAR